MPLQIQSDVFPSGCTARQPAIIAAVQNKTSSGSIVIRVAPTAAKGTHWRQTTSQKAVRALASLARKRRTISDTKAAITGARKRTPNSLSPKSEVPMNCAIAINGGLLKYESARCFDQSHW